MLNERALIMRLQRSGPKHVAELAGLCDATVPEIVHCLHRLCEEGVLVANAARGYGLARDLEWLDTDAILTRSATHARASIDQLDVAWSVDSTNTQLRHTAVASDKVRVLLAERQTGGRGRLGRSWQSPLAANLYLSILREFPGGWSCLSGLSLAVGLAMAQALESLGVASIALKWPNDVQIGGRKLGGILIEGAGERSGNVRAVIGLGLNVAMPRQAAGHIDQPWTDLAQVAPQLLSRNALAAALLDCLLPTLERFAQQGLTPFLSQYAQRDVLRGQAVAASFGDGTQCLGIAQGVADDGALRIRNAQGEHAIYAGEVSVRRA